MLGKRIRFLMVLAAALGIPYAWFNENFAGPLKTKWQALKERSAGFSGTTLHATASSAGSAVVAGTEQAVGTGGAPGGSIPQTGLRDVLRFDVDARWVTHHWDRVSTVHAEHGLEGLRVALVTGTSPGDVTGALTYYFDAQHRVRRITLRGHTGDERPLVALVSERFELRPEPMLGAGLYVRRWNGKPKNALRIMHAPVVRSDSPHTHLLFQLELNDLSAHYGLSPEFAAILQ